MKTYCIRWADRDEHTAFENVVRVIVEGPFLVLHIGEEDVVMFRSDDVMEVTTMCDGAKQ